MSDSGANVALIDTYAAGQLRKLREERGLSPEALAAEIGRSAAAARGGVDAHTIRRIERYGHVPGTRVAFVIASFFGLLPHELWTSENRTTGVGS